MCHPQTSDSKSNITAIACGLDARLANLSKSGFQPLPGAEAGPRREQRCGLQGELQQPLITQAHQAWGRPSCIVKAAPEDRWMAVPPEHSAWFPWRRVRESHVPATDTNLPGTSLGGEGSAQQAGGSCLPDNPAPGRRNGTTAPLLKLARLLPPRVWL